MSAGISSFSKPWPVRAWSSRHPIHFFTPSCILARGWLFISLFILFDVLAGDIYCLSRCQLRDAGELSPPPPHRPRLPPPFGPLQVLSAGLTFLLWQVGGPEWQLEAETSLSGGTAARPGRGAKMEARPLACPQRPPLPPSKKNTAQLRAYQEKSTRSSLLLDQCQCLCWGLCVCLFGTPWHHLWVGGAWAGPLPHADTLVSWLE